MMCDVSDAVQTAFMTLWSHEWKSTVRFLPFLYLLMTQSQLPNSICALGHISQACQYCLLPCGSLIGDGGMEREVEVNVPFKACGEVLGRLQNY